MNFLVFFSTLMWIRQTIKHSSENVVKNVREYYSAELSEHDITLSEKDLTVFVNNL